MNRQVQIPVPYFGVNGPLVQADPETVQSGSWG